jgi:hypothetical protein
MSMQLRWQINGNCSKIPIFIILSKIGKYFQKRINDPHSNLEPRYIFESTIRAIQSLKRKHGIQIINKLKKTR